MIFVIVGLALLLAVSILINVTLLMQVTGLKRDLSDEIDRKVKLFKETQSQRRTLNALHASARRIVELTAVMILLAATGTAWAQADQPGATAAESIVSNGSLQNRDFTLLLIHNSEPQSAELLAMLARPTTQALAQWRDGLSVRPMHASEPFVAQHHGGLLQQHQQQLPIVALVDGMGGVWWSVSGANVPRSEKDLVAQWSAAYAKTLKAAAESAKPAIGPPTLVSPSPPAQQLQPMWSQSTDGWYGSGPSRFLDRGIQAPEPVQLPSINIDASVGPKPPTDSAIDDSTQIITAALYVLCALILAGSLVFGATVIANAVTDEDPQ